MNDINYFYNESPTKSNTRENIIKKSIDLFINFGIEKISMLEIASNANITTRNLYRYYSSKEFLVIDCTYKAFYLIHKNNNFKNEESLTGLQQIDKFISNIIKIYSVNKIQFSKYIMFFDIYISTIPKSHPAFIKYKDVYRQHIKDSNSKYIRTALNRGIKDNTIFIQESEIDLYENYIIQSIFSLSLRINIKEYENEHINESLIIKHKNIILQHLGVKK